MLHRRVISSLLRLAFLVTGVLAGAVAWVAVLLAGTVSVLLAPLALLGAPVPPVGARLVRALAGAERARSLVLLGQELAPRAEGLDVRREVGYCLLLLPAAVLACVLAVPLWAAALSALLLPARWLVSRPAEVAPLLDWPVGLQVTAFLASGGVLVVLADRVTAALARALLRLAGSLLSPRPSDALRARITTLTQTRARMVEAATAERRRIERDLHDGAQQHLVALALSLGRAKARFASDPAGAEVLVHQAHEEAKESITALRELVRGVHPPVLTDRGLDAALSALAARSPVPVRLEVDLPHRPDPTVEAVAYFVISEALTNAVRHSGAAHLSVSVRGSDDGVRLVIRDDGRGGAQERSGGGLSGLRDRLAAVDGALTVHSPPGGGTTVTVEVPHARADR